MIRFSNISKQYLTEEGEVEVYRDFSETIEDGEFVTLIGHSGSGKTTLLKLILKEIEPDSGEITVDGQDLSKMDRKKIPFYRRNIGVIFQDFRLMQNETVYENLSGAVIATGGSGKEAEKKIIDVLTMLGIDNLHKRYPKEISGGQQQKVCLARAMINNPRVLLADEPTGNLDPASSRELIDLLKVMNDHGTTIIMATNDSQVMNTKGSRIIDLDRILNHKDPEVM